MQKTKRREWVKTFAIIFLVILLILTFFSNDIMNRSLPEVAVQSVESGTINAIIRGTGAVSADETYDVTINQTRKVRSVLVKVGDVVSAGDTLLLLEAMDSEELKTAQSELATMELNYQKSLIEASNASSTENREIQKYRDAYNEALAAYRLYSTAEPSQIALALEQAKVELTNLQRASTDAADALTSVNEEMTALQQALTEAQTEATNAQSEADALSGQIETLSQSARDKQRAIEAALQELNDAQAIKNRDWIIHGSAYNMLQECASKGGVVDYTLMAAYAEDTSLITRDYPDKQFDEDTLKAMSEAYSTITADDKKISELQTTYDQLKADASNPATGATLEQQLKKLNSDYEAALERQKAAQNASVLAEQEVERYKSVVENYEKASKDAARAAEDQQAKVDRLSAASTAAESLKAAETALEDKVFEASLGDSGSLDLKSSKEAIEKQRKLVEELTANADGQEVKANVGGKISAINVSAGNAAAAETALCTITVVDRGYTVKIPVTNDQAQKVTVGDQASISNYYNGDITATLADITNDPQNLGKGKLLVFRLSGEGVEAGANITLSIGQRSASYDCLIPNSALRNDSNGDFVLVVTSKSTPLGNRYYATRASVTVLAKDDTRAAVTGLAAGDFVITTASAPIEAGSMVRLVENG